MPEVATSIGLLLTVVDERRLSPAGGGRARGGDLDSGGVALLDQRVHGVVSGADEVLALTALRLCPHVTRPLSRCTEGPAGTPGVPLTAWSGAAREAQ